MTVTEHATIQIHRDSHMNTAQSNAQQSLRIQMIYKGGTQTFKKF
jgi:hypothetical protein